MAELSVQRMTPENLRRYVRQGKALGVLDSADQLVLLLAAEKIEALERRFTELYPIEPGDHLCPTCGEEAVAMEATFHCRGESGRPHTWTRGGLMECGEDSAHPDEGG